MKKRVTVILIFLASTAFSVINEPGKSGTLYFINVKSRLNVRTKPSLKGQILYSLPNGEMVLYLGQRKTATVNGIRGSWMLIEWQGRKGYTFSHYLRKIPSFKNNARYDGNVLRLFYSFNKVNKQTELRFNQHSTDEFRPDEDFIYKNKKIHWKITIPVSDYIYFIFDGAHLTKKAYIAAKSGKKTAFSFIMHSMTLTIKKKYERHFTIRGKLTKVVYIK